MFDFELRDVSLRTLGSFRAVCITLVATRPEDALRWISNPVRHLLPRAVLFTNLWIAEPQEDHSIESKREEIQVGSLLDYVEAGGTVVFGCSCPKGVHEAIEDMFLQWFTLPWFCGNLSHDWEAFWPNDDAENIDGDELPYRTTYKRAAFAVSCGRKHCTRPLVQLDRRGSQHSPISLPKRLLPSTRRSSVSSATSVTSMAKRLQLSCSSLCSSPLCDNRRCGHHW